MQYDDINNFNNRTSILSSHFFITLMFFRSHTELEKRRKTLLRRLNFAKMTFNFGFGLRGNYPSTHSPTPGLVKSILVQNLNPLWDNFPPLSDHMSELAQDMLWDFRGLQFEYIPTLSWVKDIVAVNSFLSNSRQGAVNSLTLRNFNSGNPRSYYFYAILSTSEYFNEAKFIAVEFHCEASESNLNQSEWEVFDSDSNDDIFLEIDV